MQNKKSLKISSDHDMTLTTASLRWHWILTQLKPVVTLSRKVKLYIVSLLLMILSPTSFALIPYAWNAITLPASSGATCGNGTPYTFFVNPNPLSTKTLVQFEGGGACWDQKACLGGDLISASNPNGVSTSYMTDFSGFGLLGLSSPLTSRIPLLGTTTETQSWNMVYAPYCTGDVHTGNKISILDDANPTMPRVQWFRGVVNARAMATWLNQNMSKPSQLLVSGFSAGGVGATANYPGIRNAIQPQQSALLADSGPLYPAPSGGSVAKYPSIPLTTTIRRAWGFDDPNGMISQLTQQYPGAFDPKDTGSFGVALAKLFPNDRFGYATFQVDAVFSKFSYLRFNPAIAALPEADQAAAMNVLWRKDIANWEATMDKGPQNIGYYIPYGRPIINSHTLTTATFENTGVVDYAIPSIENFIQNLINVPNGPGPVMRIHQQTQEMPGKTFVTWLISLFSPATYG